MIVRGIPRESRSVPDSHQTRKPSSRGLFCFALIMDSAPSPKGALVASRRTFLSLIAGSLAAPRLAFAQPATPSRLALYANVGPELTRYDVDVPDAALTRRESVRLPAGVQYAWPHANRRILYVASSS